jgi:hypothetical protein
LKLKHRYLLPRIASNFHRRRYNPASKIPALRIFGLSIAICVVLNFIFVLTIFPAGSYTRSLLSST